MMEFLIKYKKIGNIVIPIFMIWFSFAAMKDAKNHEFSKIVRSIRDFEGLESCQLETNVERSYFISWTPSVMDISMSEGESLIKMRTYGLFPPDRKETEMHDYLYRYKTSGRRDGKMVATYIEFEIQHGGKLKWIEMGECEGIPEKDYWSSAKIKESSDCTAPVIKIKCENA